MMDGIQLISTKLKAPAPRKNYIRRQALFRKLESLSERKMTVVQGSAGSGKTTLITSFMKEHAETRFRWITMDSDHNNLFTFWYYVVESLKDDLDAQVGEFYSLFEALPQKQEMENLLILLVNQLQTIEDITLVFDDFHLLEDEQLLRTLEFFIKYTPDQVRFVLLTREEPKLYLGEMMVSGRYLEIEEQELRFSTDEASLFVQETLGMRMDERTINQLNELTEGWAGGLQLMALALAQQKDLPLGQVKGLNKYTINYLSYEILSSVSDKEKQFLILTSILNYFNESICNKLLNRNDSRLLINELSDKNMFLITIDEKEGVYRYHHLFGEFLRLKFSERDEAEKCEWHRKAAAIYEERGDLEESIKHYIRAGLYGEALHLIGKMNQSIMGWTYLQQIPLEFLADSRDFLFQRLFYHFCNLEFKTCQQILDGMPESIGKDALGSLFQFTRFFIDESLTGLEMDIASIEEMEHMDFSNVTKAIIYLTASMLLGLRDQYAEALECIEKAVQLESRFHNPYILYFLLTCKSQFLEALGELKECERVYEQLFRLIEQHSYLAPLSANSLIGAGGIYMKMMQLDKAEQVFEQAKLKLPAEYLSMERGYVHNRLEMCLLQGDKPGAAKWMKRLAAFQVFHQQHPLVHSSVLKYQLLLDEVSPELLDSFIHWVEHDRKQLPLRYDDQLVYARILFMQGNQEESLTYLDSILQKVRKYKVKPVLIESILLKISILGQEGSSRKRELLNLVREAVHYSYANQIMYPYVLEGESIQKLLIQLIDEKKSDLLSKESQFVQRVLSIRGEEKADECLLSERELEVLQVLSAGLTNKEIGEKLCISVATVKTHMINIYSKLHVSNRTEAVDKGRQLGLLQ